MNLDGMHPDTMNFDAANLDTTPAIIL